MKDRLITGIVGGLCTFVLTLIVLIYFGIYDFVPISILNPKDISDNFGVDKINLIKELSQKGILLTPDEYTNRILGYYNSIITMLIASFVVFTFLGYLSIKSRIKEQIQEALNDMLRDSKTFEETIFANINGRIQDDFVQYSEFDELAEEVNNLIEFKSDFENGTQSNTTQTTTSTTIIP